ncbi:MAG: TIM barrel protein [Chloroflexi bacterium]|nr:TIM barrel protein [Chloroflexota bacterium]
MVRAGLSSFSLHLPDLYLGDPWFELDEGGKSVSGAFRGSPQIDLLEFPAQVAEHGINCVDLCIQHIPNIEPGYLAELRAAFEAADVELYQLLIDLGEIASSDPAERSASIAMTKRWMEIAAELGSTGVRYVPGDSKPNPETSRACGQAFRELYDYGVACGVEPATENYKVFNNEADDLLQVLADSERDYGLVADFGNCRGPKKYSTLEKLLPRATAIHQWVAVDDDGTLNLEDAKRCLQMARDSGFDGPVMLLGGHPYDVYRGTRDFAEAVDELRGEVQAVFGDAFEASA